MGKIKVELSLEQAASLAEVLAAINEEVVKASDQDVEGIRSALQLIAPIQLAVVQAILKHTAQGEE